MTHKLNILDKVNQEVEFELTYDNLKPYFENTFEKYRKKADIPGFRKGKVPISYIKKMYGEILEQSSLEEIANDEFKNFLHNNKIHILGEGAIIDLNFDEQKTFKFKIKYEVKPEIELTKYKGLTVTKHTRDIDDKMIDDEIKYLQSKNATYTECEEAVNEEFVVSAEIHKVDTSGLLIIGETVKSSSFYLNDKNLEPEIKKQLTGIKLNEERILSLKIGKSDESEMFKAKVTKIERVVLPEINNEFFKLVYNDDITDENVFREKIRLDVKNIYANINDQELNNNIISELIKNNDVPVPETLIENILLSFLDEIKSRNPKRLLPDNFDINEFKKQRRVEAVLRVKWYLIRDKIVELENIEVSDEDLKPLIEEDAIKYNLPEDKIRQIYENNPDVKYRILDEKLMKFLISNSEVSEEKITEEHLV